MRKKFFTFLLALVTSVGMMWAQGPWTSGDCTVTLSGGVITVSGNGAMADYHNTTPWDSYKSSITSIVIEDGVTHIGNETFCVCDNLVSVTIGNDVVTIGSYAFDDCYKFTTLTLGNSIQSIGECAFMWSKELTELNLPASLQIIGNNAFLQCKKITTVTIPSSVTSIGSQAFFYCTALTSIYAEPTTPPTLLGDGVFTNVPTSIPLYVPNGSVAAYTAAAQWNAFNIQGYDPAPVGPTNVCGDGLTWELNGGVLTISYDGVGTGEMTDFGYEYDASPVNVAPWKENKSAITTVIVGDGVKSIGNYAFNDLSENFTAVTIANSVERIGVFAFTNSEEITEITLPSSLKTIDERGFANCGFTSITIPSGVTSIGYQAFSYCKALTSLTCEATTPPTLASGVFYKIRSSTSSISSIPLYVPSESVAAYEAAAQWNAFDVQAISGGSTNPSGSCGTNLSWEFNPATGTLTITGSGAMPTTWDTPASVPWHEYRADITSVSLPDGLTTIGGYAFYSCPGLTSVTIPENVTNIAIAAFANCANLASVTLPNSVLSIGQSALAVCPSMTSLTLGSGLSSIGTAAFSGCSGLESVTNYATTPQVLDSYAFYNVEISNCELYVPEESVAAYQAATTWKDFKNVQAIGPAPTPTAVVIGDLNNTSQVETFLTTYDGQTIDELIIDRPVLNNMYNTLCLPFDMNATQIAASSLNGVEIREFTGASVEGTTLNLSVGDPVNAVVAGRPYFVKYSAASQLDNLHFEEVTINNALLDNMAVTFDGVTFKGTFTPFVMPNGLNFQGGYLFLGQNNQLFWPSTSNPLKPFRAYFYVNVESSTPGNAPKYRGMPARIVEGKNVATGVENAQSANQSTKVIVNGQLIIIKNDVRYNAQGQIVK